MKLYGIAFFLLLFIVLIHLHVWRIKKGQVSCGDTTSNKYCGQKNGSIYYRDVVLASMKLNIYLYPPEFCILVFPSATFVNYW